MPLYDYDCSRCDTRFEHLAPAANADGARCPSCGSGEVRKLLSVIGGMTGRADAPAPSCGAGACGACS